MHMSCTNNVNQYVLLLFAQQKHTNIYVYDIHNDHVYANVDVSC